MSQEKLQTMSMQFFFFFFGGGVKEVHYGIVQVVNARTQHNVPGWARTRTTRSGVEHINHEATPPQFQCTSPFLAWCDHRTHALNRQTTKPAHPNICGQKNILSFKLTGPRKDYNDLDLTILLIACNRDLDALSSSERNLIHN